MSILIAQMMRAMRIRLHSYLLARRLKAGTATRGRTSNLE